jgi:predicted transcriptional regulator
MKEETTAAKAPKVYVDDKTVITFTDAETWKDAAGKRGLSITNRGENGEDEYFAEKGEEEDVTMIGYYKDDWGMLV